MKEEDRWWYGIVALLSLAVVLFLLVVILNSRVIFVEFILKIFQVGISILFVVICGFVAWFMIKKVMKSISDAEAEINNQLESMRKVLSNFAYKLGADLLALTSGVLIFFAQEISATYALSDKLCISILFFMVFFFASQLIGSSRVFTKTMGIVFYIAPIMSLFAIFFIFGDTSKLKVWYQSIQTHELLMIYCTAISIACGFVFAFLKNKRIQDEIES